MAGSQVTTSVTILNNLYGFQAISLTNFDSSALSAIAAGSKVEIAGAFFTFATDDTPDAASWTAVSTSSTAFLVLTPSGSAGSQIVSATWTATGPVWVASKKGWYATAASVARVVARVLKAGTSTKRDPMILSSEQQFLSRPFQLSKRFTNTVNISGAAVTIQGLPDIRAYYHVVATFSGSYCVSCFIKADGLGNIIKTTDQANGGGGLTISLSGFNLQLTQTSGSDNILLDIILTEIPYYEAT